MSDPFELMGLLDSAAPSEVKARFIELSKTLHPDHGGSLESFQELRTTYDEAMAIAQQPRLCTAEGCERGKVATMNGFTTTWKNCPTCGGKGKVVLE